MPKTNEELQLELENLKEEFRLFKEHQHLGADGSKEFSDSTKFRGRELLLSGAGTNIGGFVTLPLNIADATTQENVKKRLNGMGIAVQGTKGTTDELIIGAYLAGLATDENDLVSPPNKSDWDKINYAAIRFIHSPQSVYSASGPTLIPPQSFFSVRRTPEPTGTGTLTLGGNTFTDSNANFEIDVLILGILNIFTTAGVFVEAHRITANTATTITIDDYPYGGAGVWAAASGSYVYTISMPVLLGDAQIPFQRLYVADDIRLGFGPSAGTQPRYIKWGMGDPITNGVIANIGSIYLRFDGGSNTTIYVKKADNGASTGWLPLLDTQTTGLAGTKTYYVADSSGGTVDRKLTFTNGLLTSET